MPNQTVGQCWNRQAARQTLERHSHIVGGEKLGVEVELEGITNDRMQSDYWEVKGDGSLRNNGREFVFQSPTGGKDLFNALLELDTFLFDKNPDSNWRGSTHVHLDVRNMNLKQLKFLVLTYLMYEKFIFRLSGMHRYKNNFCCAIGFAQDQLMTLSKAWSSQTTYDFTNYILNRWDKYSALNFCPISSFGSVEFRMSEPKWRKGQLTLLCNRILSMKELAMNWEGTERELIDHLMETDPRHIMGKGLRREIPAAYTEDILVGYKLANDLLAFSEYQAENQSQRNNLEAARELMIPARNHQWTAIPEEKWLGDSPFIAVTEDLIPRVAEIARGARLEIHDVMFQEMNCATLKWLCQSCNLAVTHVVSPEDYLVFQEWDQENRPQPIRRGGAAGRPRFEAPQVFDWEAPAPNLFGGGDEDEDFEEAE